MGNNVADFGAAPQWVGVVGAILGALGLPMIAQKLFEHFSGHRKNEAEAAKDDAEATKAAAETESVRVQTLSDLYSTVKDMLDENRLLRESQERMELENHELKLSLRQMKSELHEMRSNFRILCSAFLVFDSNCGNCAKNPIQGKVREMIDSCLKLARENLTNDD